MHTFQQTFTQPHNLNTVYHIPSHTCLGIECQRVQMYCNPSKTPPRISHDLSIPDDLDGLHSSVIGLCLVVRKPAWK